MRRADVFKILRSKNHADRNMGLKNSAFVYCRHNNVINTLHTCNKFRRKFHDEWETTRAYTCKSRYHNVLSLHVIM